MVFILQKYRWKNFTFVGGLLSKIPKTHSIACVPRACDSIQIGKCILSSFRGVLPWRPLLGLCCLHPRTLHRHLRNFHRRFLPKTSLFVSLEKYKIFGQSKVPCPFTLFASTGSFWTSRVFASGGPRVDVFESNISECA